MPKLVFSEGGKPEYPERKCHFFALSGKNFEIYVTIRSSEMAAFPDSSIPLLGGKKN